MLRRLLVVADAAALAFSFLIVQAYGGFDVRPASSLLQDLLLLGISLPVWIALAHAHDLYHVDTRHADHRTADEVVPLVHLTTLWSWSIGLLAIASGLESFWLPALVVFWALTFLLLVILRAVLRAWARRQLWYLQNVVVVGDAAESGAIARRLFRHPEYGINLAACVELSGDGVGSHAGVDKAELQRTLGSVPLIRGDVEVAKLIDELDVDRVLLAPSVGSFGKRGELVSELSQLPVQLDVVPGWGEMLGGRMELHEMEGLPVLTFPSIGLSRSSLLLKRTLDIALTATALAVISPVLIVVALATKIDSPGPVLFRQCRVGRNDRRFELLKFRSMSDNAEALQEQLADLTLHGGASENGLFKVAEDPRVTRVGRILRRFSLDELPQLFNVLRGDMSLVGPRPLPVHEHERITGRHRRRADLLPGITGLWQVHGRSNIPFEGMVDLDYLYVTNWSLSGDLKVLLRTGAVVAHGRGSY